MKRVWVRSSQLAALEGFHRNERAALEAEIESYKRQSDAQAVEIRRLRSDRDRLASEVEEHVAAKDRANERARKVAHEAEHARRTYEGRAAALEDSDPEKFARALKAIHDEPVPILPSDDIANVHIPGTYAERVRKLAGDALKES